jgi:hypothetical protein
MTRWLLAVLAVAMLAGCNKPAEEDCRKGIRNMQRLLGTDKLHSAQNVESAVRSCRGASTKKSVECAIQAQTLDQLKQCSFWKEQGMKDEPGSAGSGSSAASGSAAVPPPAPAPAPAPEPAPAGSGSAPAPAPAPAGSAGSGS